MSLFMSPVLTTPLLKVPLLVSAAVCGHQGMKPPTPPPRPKEETKYNRSDYLSNNNTGMLMGAHILRVSYAAPSRFHLRLSCSQLSVGGLALAEVAIILAQRFRSPLSDHVLALLWPVHALPPSLTRTTLVGAALTLTGGLLRIWCHRILGRHFTWQLAVLDDHSLITEGPYAIVRHPGYTAFAMLTVGEILMTYSAGSYFAEAGLWKTVFGKIWGGFVVGWLIFVTGNLFARVPKEDATLRKEFGAQWDAWARRTPYRILPFVY